MINFQNDSIPTPPSPIAKAIIQTFLTRLVTADRKVEDWKNFVAIIA
jgi:hypothetical protein